jgi:hypothetical protein
VGTATVAEQASARGLRGPALGEAIHAARVQALEAGLAGTTPA